MKSARAAFSAAVTVMVILAVTGASEGTIKGLDIRHADGTPVLWDNGMPYFTRFNETDHEVMDLGGDWAFMADPADEGTRDKWFEPGYDDSDWRVHPVPGSWNVQQEDLLYYEGAGWYRTRFTPPASMAGRFTRLVLDGVSYRGDVYLNGKLVGSHHGGFSRWSIDASEALRPGEENVLAVRVDNRRDFDSIPALTSKGSDLGWWYYGGIHREVFLESGPWTTACKLAVDTDHEGKISGDLVLYNRRDEDRRVKVVVDLKDLGGADLARLAETEAEVPAGDMALVEFADIVEDVEPWSPATPENRYVLEVSISSGEGSEKQSTRIGFRKFEFRGTEAYLNGMRIFLRGVNRHEDYPESGPVLGAARIEEDMALLEELRVNFMRPAHYPSDPRWLDACDEKGLMIAHEVPLYQVGRTGPSKAAVKGDALYEDAATQLIETIERDRNHPSAVMWSVGNENWTFAGPVRDLTRRMYDTAKNFDPDRPVSFAVLTVPILSPGLEKTAGIGDAIFVNEYFGWYFGSASGIGSFLDKVHARWPDKPVVVSEFGAGSMPGLDGQRKFQVQPGLYRDYTEEYQVKVYETQLERILARDYVVGVMPWVFADFRDDKRPHNPRVDFNQKGLLTYERERKNVFFTVKETYEGLEEKYGW